MDNFNKILDIIDDRLTEDKAIFKDKDKINKLREEIRNKTQLSNLFEQ